jgi:hypothetical protein
MNLSNLYGRFVLIDKSTSDVYVFDNEADIASRFIHNAQTSQLLGLLEGREPEFVGDPNLITPLRRIVKQVVVEGVTAKMLEDVGKLQPTKAGAQHSWQMPQSGPGQGVVGVSVYSGGGGGGSSGGSAGVASGLSGSAGGAGGNMIGSGSVARMLAMQKEAEQKAKT